MPFTSVISLCMLRPTVSEYVNCVNHIDLFLSLLVSTVVRTQGFLSWLIYVLLFFIWNDVYATYLYNIHVPVYHTSTWIFTFKEPFLEAYKSFILDRFKEQFFLFVFKMQFSAVFEALCKLVFNVHLYLAIQRQ